MAGDLNIFEEIQQNFANELLSIYFSGIRPQKKNEDLFFPGDGGPIHPQIGI
jgi:hypothetical protein